jgi:uncharacterized membrane protein
LLPRSNEGNIVDPLVLLLRLLHVGLGVFWAGSVLFTTIFLMPAVTELGPDGGKLMAALQRRRMLEVLPVVAILTIISGFWMYIRMAGGSAEWARSRPGMALGLGGVLAVVALLMGFVVMRPTQLKAAELGAEMAKIPEGPERAARAAELQKLRRRGATAAKTVAALLGVTVILMAVARSL